MAAQAFYFVCFRPRPAKMMSPELRTEFNVAQLLKEPIGGTRAYDVLVPVPHEDAELAQTEPLVGHVAMLRTNRGILVEATLSGTVVVECSRCLKGVTTPITVHLEEEFQPTVDVVKGTFIAVEEDDTALLIDEHHILDIAEVVRQAVLLEIPMQVLCKPDCLGLCPTCGQDLNAGPCGCLPADADPRWADLSALLSDVEM
jgi:uncharacterized protein